MCEMMSVVTIVPECIEIANTFTITSDSCINLVHKIINKRVTKDVFTISTHSEIIVTAPHESC